MEYFFLEHVAQYGLSYGTVEEFNFRMNIFGDLSSELAIINNT